MKTAPKDFRSQRIYVDTNVWIGFLAENDSYAVEFFRKTSDCQFTIVLSDVVTRELIRNDAYDSFVFDELTRQGKLVVRKITPEIRSTARSFKTPSADALHAAVALDAGVPLLTWNVKDFIVPGLHVVKPNEINK